MHRDPLAAVIALGLLLDGVYIASYLPGLFIGPPVPLVLVGFVVQAMAGIGSAVAVWRGSRWAAVSVVVLGAAVAFTALVEGPVLGLISLDHALATGLVGMLVALAIATYVRGSRAAS